MTEAAFLQESGFDIPLRSAERLAAIAGARKVRKGEYLFHKGDPGDVLYVVRTGALEAVALSIDGRELVFKAMGPGETIGELTIIDGAPRTASMRACVDSEVLAMRRTDFLDAARQDPDIALGLALQIALKMRRLSGWAEDASFADTVSRVASILLESAGTGDGQRTAVTIRATQQSLADRLGVTRESVNKALRSLEDDGFVELGRRSVRITDIAALQSLVIS